MRAPANALARKHGRCCVSVSSSIDTVSLKYRPFSLLMATFPNVICFSIFPLLLTGGSFPLTLPVPHSEHPQSPDAPGDRGEQTPRRAHDLADTSLPSLVTSFR